MAANWRSSGCRQWTLLTCWLRKAFQHALPCLFQRLHLHSQSQLMLEYVRPGLLLLLDRAGSRDFEMGRLKDKQGTSAALGASELTLPPSTVSVSGVSMAMPCLTSAPLIATCTSQ